MNDGPLIVQSDKTLLLEVDHEQADACRKAIAPFAELERSPEHIHTYRLTPLGLWNARAAGHDAEQVVNVLLTFSRYAVPHALLVDVAETMARYGRLRLDKHPVHGLVLPAPTGRSSRRCCAARRSPACSASASTRTSVAVHPSQRGNLKQALLKLGWPAEDFAGYVDGEAHAIKLDETDWTLRTYQQEAADSFWHGGSGVVVLPCGAGKTLVGAAAMARAQATTLILVTNTVSARQWKSELVRRTSLTEDEIGEYSGAKKEIRPVTIATYQVLTMRRKGVYPHLELLDARDWGLIVYDEVHLLPAPDLPDDRRPAGPPPDRPDRHPGARGRPRGRRVQPDRPEAVRRPLEGHREPGLDRARRLRRGAGHPARGRAAGLRDGRARGALPAGQLHPRQDPGRRAAGRAAPRRADAGDRPVPRPARRARRAPRRSGHQGRDHGQGARAALRRRSATARSTCWWSPRWPTSPSTCPRPPSRSRSPAPSAPARRRRSGWVACCGPKADGKTARFYTIVSRDTVDADFAQNRQRFLAEQGYAYRIVDAADL